MQVLNFLHSEDEVSVTAKGELFSFNSALLLSSVGNDFIDKLYRWKHSARVQNSFYYEMKS